MVGKSGQQLLSVMVGATVVASAAAHPEPGFWLMGLPPGAIQGTTTCLSKDGVTAGGVVRSFNPYYNAGYTWTATGGRYDFGLLPGMPKSNSASGISDNGIVAGQMFDGANIDTSRAFRWPGSGPLQDLGVPTGWSRSYAWDVSGDGNVIVGHAESGPQSNTFGQAFRWTAAGGMKGLGYLDPRHLFSRANAISRDGSTIVGVSYLPAAFGGAFVWMQATGMEDLPSLSGNGGNARAVNADGTVIVGDAPGLDGKSHAVRWKNGAIEDLFLGLAFGVSDDGSVVGGKGSGSDTAVVWTPDLEATELAAYLASFGVNVPANYKLEYVYAVSGDGLTFGGQAKNLATGLREGFVATIPNTVCKVDCDASGSLDIDDFICFQTRYAISDPYADCDASGSLDIDDFICFQTLFAIGC